MRDDKLIEAMARAMWDAEPQLDEWDRAHPEARCRRMNMARAALAALREQGYAVVLMEPVAWRRPSISGRHRWIFAYAREAAHFNQGEWEPLYAAAPQPEEAQP